MSIKSLGTDGWLMFALKDVLESVFAKNFLLRHRLNNMNVGPLQH